MKKTWILASALTLVLAAPAAAADFGIFGTYAQAADVSDSAGLGIKTTFGSGPVGFTVRATYLPDLGESFDDLFDNDNDFGNFELTAVPLDAGVTFGFGAARQFWVGGGATYVILDPEIGSADDQAGWYAEAGFKTGRPTGINFFVEGVYRGIESTVNFDADDFENIDFRDEVDLDLSGVSVNAGILFTW